MSTSLKNSFFISETIDIISSHQINSLGFNILDFKIYWEKN